MENKVSFFVLRLDEGFTITEKGKIKAVESANIEKYLLERFKKAIPIFNNAQVSNAFIEITVIGNVPTIVAEIGN